MPDKTQELGIATTTEAAKTKLVAMVQSHTGQRENVCCSWD